MLTLLSKFLSLGLGLSLFLLKDLLLVGLEMGRKIELGEEPAVAVLAGEPLLALVDLHVLVQIGFLSERVVAFWESAFVWSLLSVDS